MSSLAARGRSLRRWKLRSSGFSIFLLMDEDFRACKRIFYEVFKKNNTGWSLKTVNCNLFLTNPKNSKSAKTRWFSESLYREVLVFWCFKTVRCVEICLSELFQYRAFATQYRAWPLIYNLIRFFLFPTIHCITFWYTCIRVEKKAKKGKGFPWLLWRIVILSCCDI